ncbi:MAG: hypothetical protein A2X56_05105 [Nitrospirae bacterium GWC2_57_13]|nr:MAG: hypothetical protein A2072_01205 [Nitrospirae bacterium GWC1_57_7]OGW27273.1 MAG: hypothetical protein A2X56_05105 [Nitrospirae bacterium GWC2_57_13]OGW44968.1 MAG: hypothetical protein A2X57_06495 [Nitrospirae bacterium GWD2_57_8]HAR46332.1 bifunctional folylpolyglutamate synthase/dihydrofolate synthase [Nitrospiraceae bacterium]
MADDPSYQETIEYLYGLQKHGIKLGLDNSRVLMELLGDPHRRFRSVHIAGTNGKGSTAAFLASLLRTAGLRTGLYTSPHLVSFTERIRIDNFLISEARVVELARRVRAAYRSAQLPPGAGALNPTFFEVTTTLAFTYFAEEGVDIAVIETGMGGRLDSTNVVTPLVSVITNIDLEHTEFLGTTLQQIAVEKAGIIKPGVPVVTGVVQPEVISVLEMKAREAGASLYRLGKDFSAGDVSVREAGQEFVYRGTTGARARFTIPQFGRYQVDNACLALASAECLQAAGIVLTGEQTRKGLAQARWEGRLERVAVRPDIYLDGAHNPASARVLALTVAEMKRTYRKTHLVLGVLADKDWRGIAAALLPLADSVIVTRPAYSRALETERLAAEVGAGGALVSSASTVVEALAAARAAAAVDDLILVTGSLYVVGEAREALVPENDGSAALKGLTG